MACAVWIVLLQGCDHKEEKKATAARATPALPGPGPGGPPGTQPLRVDTSSFYLELGSLYERYQDPKAAAESFAKAIEKAENPAQSVQGQTGLARVKEAQGDTDGAISALENALAEREKPQAPPPGPGALPPMMGFIGSGEDLVERLGRLYTAKGRYDDAERLYGKLLAGTKDPYQRDQVLRLQVALFRKAGTLDKHIQEREKALEAKTPDEPALRFLAIAYGGGEAGMGMPVPGVAGGPAGPAPSVDKLVRVYERLHGLHPDDAQIRQMLIGLYERSKRVDDALALVRAAAPPSPGAPGMGQDPMACPGGVLMPRPLAGTLSPAAEAVRLLVRAGRKDQALVETAKLIARATDKNIGVQAFVVGSQLYAEQSKPELAATALANGLKAARTSDEKRELQATQAELLTRTGKTAELKALYAKWKQSDDACLRAEAARRDQMLAQMLGLPPTRAMP